LAASFVLVRQRTESGKALSPEKQRLVTKKEELEARIDRLKYEKAAMEENEYKHQLTALLLELARTQAEIDR
jgi:3-phenylpropionate/cinnamic acid dioxygenase small subunit